MKDETKGDTRRTAERVPMRADKPVYLEINLDGSNVALLVENLSSDGASVIYPEESPLLQPGSSVKECTLSLAGTGNIRVHPIVRWRMWPKLGVQFDEIGEDARNQIARFLENK
jgi:c-di-GMP-binding flagellar brake protein YcgR